MAIISKRSFFPLLAGPERIIDFGFVISKGPMPIMHSRMTSLISPFAAILSLKLEYGILLTNY